MLKIELNKEKEIAICEMEGRKDECIAELTLATAMIIQSISNIDKEMVNTVINFARGMKIENGTFKTKENPIIHNMLWQIVKKVINERK